jgi:hypothetical protein
MEIHGVMIPGPELRVRKDHGLTAPMIVRIVAVYPHGTAGFRYDFHCIPMVPGKQDLTSFLETTGGEPAIGLKPLVIEATSVLPAGPVGELAKPPANTIPRAGGYGEMIPIGLGFWAASAIGVFWYFRKRKASMQLAEALPQPTLGEQLRSQLQRAIASSLGTGELAELERLVLAYCRERLGLADASDPAVYDALRDNPTSALWLSTLEAWLHRPSTSPPKPDELRQLLAEIP